MINSIYYANMKCRMSSVNPQLHELLATAYELSLEALVLPQLNIVFDQFIYH